MPEEIFGQKEQPVTSVNMPAPSPAFVPTPSPAPDPTPAPAPVQVPPTTNLSGDLLPKKGSPSKLLWAIIIIIFAVLVIGGAGVIGFLLSRMQQNIVGGGSENSGPTVENGVVTPVDESATQSEPGAEQPASSTTTGTGTVPGASVQSPAGGTSGAGVGAGEPAQPSAPAAGAANQPVVNAPQLPAVQVPAAPAVQIPAAGQAAVNPPIQNLISAGTVKATLDSASPKTQVVAEKTTVNTAEFKLSAQNETFKITDITLALNDETVPKSIIAVYLKYDGGTYKNVLNADNISRNHLVIKNLDLKLAPDAAKILTVSYQLGAVQNETMSGKDIRTALYSMKGIDSKGKSLSYGKVITGNSIYVYKSYPAISAVALPGNALAKGINTLAKFSVTNIGGSKIAWRRVDLTFNCKLGQLVCGVSSGMEAYKESGIYDLEVLGPGVAAGEEGENLLIKNISVYRVETLNGVTSQLAVPGNWHFTHYAGGKVLATFITNADQEVVGSRTYVVKGDVLMNVTAGDFVSTKFGATSPVMVSSAGSGETRLNPYPSLFWTDYSATNHGDTSGDWHNDYLIKYLPLPTQTIKK